MNKLSVKDLDVAGKNVFVRVDFNVPIEGGRITDDTRIVASLPTLKHLRERRARLVVASHLGRPKGGPNPKYSMRPVAARLRELLGIEVRFAEDSIGEAAQRQSAALGDGDVLLLENLRFHPEEEKNDAAFAQALARHARLYVSDAFGAVHRAHASIAGITRHVEKSAAGFLLEREIQGLGRVMADPKPPFLLLMGGAKVADKIPVIEHLLPRVRYLAIGGGMAFTFLKAMGVGVGRSLVEDDKLGVAAKVLEAAEKGGVDVSLPVDHVAATELKAGVETEVVESDRFPEHLMGLDIGPITLNRYRELADQARTIVWNGPMGVFETPPFEKGTIELARAVASSLAYSVVGGGDSVAALHQAGVEERIGHVSTGGGASLEFLAGQTLPGIAALSDRGA